MDSRSLDQTITISIIGGGIVISLYSVLQVSLRFFLTDELSFDSYRNELHLTLYAGLFVIFFGLFYGIFTLRKKQASIDQIWNENRKSVIKYCLSLVDQDVKVMNWIFQKLESDGFDFNKNSDKLTLGIFEDIDHNRIKERFNNIPLLNNVLGFITYEQYMAIFEYLKCSSMFIDLLDKQNYQKEFLQCREKYAKKILELFRNEIKDHFGLLEWRKHFSTNYNQY